MAFYNRYLTRLASYSLDIHKVVRCRMTGMNPQSAGARPIHTLLEAEDAPSKVCNWSSIQTRTGNIPETKEYIQILQLAHAVLNYKSKSIK